MNRRNFLASLPFLPTLSKAAVSKTPTASLAKPEPKPISVPPSAVNGARGCSLTNPSIHVLTPREFDMLARQEDSDAIGRAPGKGFTHRERK